MRYTGVVDMFICLDKEIGSIVTSDVPLNDAHYVLCDGRQINRADYPELFTRRYVGDRARLPDMRGVLEGIEFYMIAKL
jgi:hypothetical protein